MTTKTKNRFAALTSMALLLTLVSLAPAEAQRKQARVWGVVTDSDAAPIEGARVTARDPKTGEVKADETTDTAGEYSLLINDATVTYNYRIEKDGYVPWEGELEVEVKGNAEYNFTLPSAEGQSRLAEDGSYQMHPDAVEPFTRGIEAARGGDFETAFAAFEEVLAVDAQVVPAYVALAAIHLERGEYTEAAERAAQARELDAADAKATEIAYAAAKQTGATVDELLPILAELELLAPEKAAAGYTEIGNSHFRAGDMAAAESALNKAVELAPDLAQAHFQLGLCYVNQGETDAARVHFEKVVELTPDSDDAVTAREMLGYLGS